MATKDPRKAQIESDFADSPDLRRLALKMHRELPDGRHKSLALTAMEEAAHWAQAAYDAAGRAGGTPAPSGATSTKAAPAAKAAPAKKAAAPAKTAAAPAAKKAAPAKAAAPAEDNVRPFGRRKRG